MLSLKDKVADKLSRLLADSPSPHPLDSSPIARSEPDQAVSAYMGELFPTKKSSFSSFFLSFIPTTFYGNDEPNKPTVPLPFRSLPRRWKMNSFSLKDKPLDCSTDSRTDTESDSADELSKENLEHVPERNCNGYHGVEEACMLHDSREFFSLLTDKSAFISEDLFEFFQSSLPNIVKGCKWVLLYSTLRHGISLQTLLRRSANLSGPCLLIAGDMQGAIFGGLLDSPLKTTFKRKYQGTSQTFVFTTIYGEPRQFRATGANRFYYMCLNNLLAFGGGGSFALCLEEDLLHGTSGPSETFGNLCLAHSPEFELKNVEVWGFTYSSQYLCMNENRDVWPIFIFFYSNFGYHTIYYSSSVKMKFAGRTVSEVEIYDAFPCGSRRYLCKICWGRPMYNLNVVFTSAVTIPYQLIGFKIGLNII